LYGQEKEMASNDFRQVIINQLCASQEHSWVNLGGGGWPDHFYAGGHMIDNGLDIVRAPDC